jgi:tRNA threonylcarbamoyladenosine biosynthesis protein TsaE
MTTLALELADPAATERAGAAIADGMRGRSGGVIFLSGTLGAGKTSIARGLLQALGVRGPIRSPSYTLVEPYECDGHTILHLDLYRLRDADEFEGLGLRDFSPQHAWWIVEWPEHGEGHLPAPDLWLHLSIQAAGRHLRVQGGRPDSCDSLFSMLRERFAGKS